MSRKRNILFLCTANACRSQMAEGWARHLHGEKMQAFSAGVAPRSVDPLAIRVMAEAGVDLATHRSKSVHDLLEVPFDLVVTVCDGAHEQCPIFPGRAKILHHGFADPPALARGAQSEAEVLACYRRVRDEIRAFVAALPASPDYPGIA